MEDLIGSTILRRYRIEKVLGYGGMADVYLATDLRRQAQVAVKVLREDLAEDPEFVRRFRKEAEALARLDHPNIARLYEFVQQGATACVVMDYIKGITLRRRLVEAGGPLGLEEITSILRQVSAALGYAHSEGIIHRDIKPGNIMLQEGGRVLLTDFGIAKVIESGTVTTMALGTPAYMSPEQIEGLALDQRTDIYSLGVMLYEIATGRRPFTGERGSGTTTLEKIRDEQIRLQPVALRVYNPKLPEGVVRVILHALAREREDRWDDVDALGKAWERALPQGVTSSHEVKSIKVADQPHLTKPLILKTPVAGLLFLGAILFLGVMIILVKSSLGARNQPSRNDSIINNNASSTPKVNLVVVRLATATEAISTVSSKLTQSPSPKPSILTPTLTKTTTPTTTPSPTKAQPTPTNCGVAINSAFAGLNTQDQLGCPLGDAQRVWCALQPFEGGYMLWRQDTLMTTIFFNGGSYEEIEDDWLGKTYSINEIPPVGRVAPQRGFGWLWSKDATIRSQLGWGLAEEKGCCMLIQKYANGLLVRSVTGDCGPEFNRANEGDFPHFVVLATGNSWIMK